MNLPTSVNPIVDPNSLSFDAFISYSHRSDRALARALESTLRTFGRKWYQIRRLRTYRDETNLAAEPELWNTIEAAVRQSRFLILLASPDSAQSEWVPREVSAMLEARGASALCIVQTGGVLPWTDKIHPSEMLGRKDLSLSLGIWSRLNKLGFVPLVIDLRPFRDMQDQDREKNPEYLSLVATIAAKLLNTEKEAIWGQYYRALRLRITFLTATLALLVALIVGLGWSLLLQRRETRLAESRATAADARLAANKELNVALRGSAAAYRLSPSVDAQAALLESLGRAAQVVGFFPCHVGEIGVGVAFSRDAKPQIAFSCIDEHQSSSLSVVDYSGNVVLDLPVSGDARSLSFFDANTVAYGGSSSLRILNVNSRSSTAYATGGDVITLVTAAPDSRLIFSVDAKGLIRAWQRPPGADGDWTFSIFAQTSSPAIKKVQFEVESKSIKAFDYRGYVQEFPIPALAGEPPPKVVEDIPWTTTCKRHDVSIRMATTDEMSNGQLHAFNTEDNNVVIDTGGGEPCRELYGNTHNFSVRLSGDGTRVASIGAIADGDSRHGLIIWDLRQVHPLARSLLEVDGIAKEIEPLLAISNDGSSWACSKCRNEIIWNGVSIGGEGTAASDEVQALALTSDGQELAFASKDGRIGLIDIGARKPRYVHRVGALSEVQRLWYSGRDLYYMSADGQLAKSSSDDNDVRPLSSRFPVGDLAACNDFYPFGAEIATEVRVKQGETTITFEEMGRGERRSIVVPDSVGPCSSLIYSGSAHLGVRLPLNYKDPFIVYGSASPSLNPLPNPLRDESGHPTRLSKPQISASGERLAALSNDNAVALFDLREKRLIGTFAAPNAKAVAISGDGNAMLTYGTHSGLLLWDLDSRHWASIAEKIAGF
jgi:WD40 repeat protein